MSKMIQIRDVPEDVHRRLKVRAAEAGLTLSDYLRAEVERVAARPTRAEILARLTKASRGRLPESAAAAIRAERDAR